MQLVLILVLHNGSAGLTRIGLEHNLVFANDTANRGTRLFGSGEFHFSIHFPSQSHISRMVVEFEAPSLAYHVYVVLDHLLIMK